MKLLVATFISAALINNFVLVRFLGLCPFIGVSKQRSAALGMSTAVIFVMTLTSILTWLVRVYLLEPFGIGYMEIVAFILLIAGLVQISEKAIHKLSRPLYQSLGIYLPLITTNCAVLGVALLNSQERYGFIQATVAGFGAAVGFGLVLLIFSELRARIELSRTPKAFAAMNGAPIAFVVAGILSLAFMGFAGLGQ